MNPEKVNMEQAVQKLSEVSNNYNTRITDLENKISDIHVSITGDAKDGTKKLTGEIATLQDAMANKIETIQMQTREWQDKTMSKFQEKEQQWDNLTDDMKDMKAEIKKVLEALTMNQTTKNIDDQAVENRSCASLNDRNSSSIDESFVLARSSQHTNQAEQNGNYTIPAERTTHIPQTIVIQPASSIPTFGGNINENARQFLIRVKQYGITVNRWPEQELLNGVSQFLRNTVLEWYCQLSTSHRCPKTWTDFTVIFLNHFNSPLRRSRQEELWKNCKQEENEPTNEFIVRLRSLWIEQKPNENEDDLVRHLVRKMKNNILLMIGSARNGSLDEVLMEAQKVEDIIYQRSKEQRRYNNNNKQEILHHNDMPTPLYDEEEQYEVPAMSAHQMKRRFDLHIKRNDTNNHFQSQYRHIASQLATNQRQTQSINELKCYTCGKKGRCLKRLAFFLYHRFCRLLNIHIQLQKW